MSPAITAKDVQVTLGTQHALYLALQAVLSPSKDGKRAGDLLNRDFTAAAPNRIWVMDFSYCRTWAGFAYVAFIVDVFAQKIVAWHSATSKDVELVMTPLRMATWQRQCKGRPIVPGELLGHADARVAVHSDSLH